MAIGEAEAFSERMKRELVALESANVYALMETESVVEEVCENFCYFVNAFSFWMPIGALLFSTNVNSVSDFWQL
jgi:hypothetical protein